MTYTWKKTIKSYTNIVIRSVHILITKWKAITGMEEDIAWISFTNSVCILHFFNYVMLNFFLNKSMSEDLVNHAISFRLLTFAPSICLQTMITCPRNDPQCGYKPGKTLSFKEVKIKLVCSESVWMRSLDTIPLPRCCHISFRPRKSLFPEIVRYF